MNSRCYLCGSENLLKRCGTVRDNADIDILQCSNCGLVFLSSFEHIHTTFYEDSGMHARDIDTNAWLRQSAADDERRYKQLRRTIENKRLLDFGCGAGGFLMHARHTASSCCGVEVESRLAGHFSKNSLEVYNNLCNVPGRYDIITLFHVLEHFPDPGNLLKQLGDKLSQDGQIIIEVPNSEDALLTLYECDAFTDFTYWSCHLFLFNAATIKKLADQSGFKTNHVQHIQRYSLANHLHWLSKGKPGGHIKWAFLDNERLDEAYAASLSSAGISDTIFCSLSKH